MNDLLSYDPETGVIVWKVSRRNAKVKGSEAGYLQPNGYIYIKVSGNLYRAHRLAWLLHHGVWPKDQIDHINGVKTDNRICNLREATHSNNQRNCGKYATNTSGYKGVTKQYGKYRARCWVNGKEHHIGLFTTAKEAHKAYCKFAKTHHAEFFNPGNHE